jgi:hypothetical protein
MGSVPNDWHEVVSNDEIAQCVPLFLETDARHYRKMTVDYCREKIDYDCMHLWRKETIDWDDQSLVVRQGMAMAFHLWRPRYSDDSPLEARWCPCLFLGNQLSTPATIVEEVKTVVRAFADSTSARDRFYIVKAWLHGYPDRIERLFTLPDIQARVEYKGQAPREYGWPRRDVWKINVWT